MINYNNYYADFKVFVVLYKKIKNNINKQFYDDDDKTCYYHRLFFIVAVYFKSFDHLFDHLRGFFQLPIQTYPLILEQPTMTLPDLCTTRFLDNLFDISHIWINIVCLRNRFLKTSYINSWHWKNLMKFLNF